MKNFQKKVIIEHYSKNWSNNFSEHVWGKGPMQKVNPQFSILEFSPFKNRNMWTYATCMMSSKGLSNPLLELHIFSPRKEETLIELLTAISYSHYNLNHINDTLDLWHSVNFGKPWLENSKCDHGLISLPYLDGPALENLLVDNIGMIKFYWLIPITLAERNFKKEFGVEILEQRFEDLNVNYIDQYRNSIV